MQPLFGFFLLSLTLLWAASSLADTSCEQKESCIEQQSWQIGVAFGIGIKTNPLVDGRNIPLVVLPDIAWYGEKAYFDNGELGIQWADRPKYSIETFLVIDQERAFFSFLHPANIFIPDSSLVTDSPEFDPATPNNQGSRSLSIDDIAKRKWAVNAGLRWHYFFDNAELTTTLEQDTSAVHQGQKLNIGYSIASLWQDVRFNFRISASWKSTKLIDYYYGVSERDTNNSEFYFAGKSGWQPQVAINMSKRINEQWQWLGSLSYRHLPRSLTDSPLINKNSVRRIFVGTAYRF